MISAVLFDMDGTLLETEELKALSYARAAVELRPEHVREADVLAAFGDLVGLSREEVASALMRRFGLEVAARERMHEFEADEPWQAFAGVRLRIYEGLLDDPDLLLKQRYPHNIELLHELRRQGYPTALTTMSHRHHVRRVLSVLGLADAFDVVVPRDDVQRGKPDPEIDLLAARKLGIPPEEFLVIEDSPAGVKAALAAGMVVIAVATTLTRRGLRESGALDPQWVVEDPRTLPAVVRRRIEAAGGKLEKEWPERSRSGSGMKREGENMGFRGAIFDVDGVLVDSPHEQAWREGLHQLMENEWSDIQGQTSYAPEKFTPEVYQRVMSGKPRYAGAQAALEHFGVPDAERRALEYGDRKQVMIVELIEASEFHAYPDALRFVLAVKDAGLRIAAASSSKNANAFLERIRLDEFVEEEGLSYGFVEPGYTLLDILDANVSGRDFEQGKPHPEIFLAAAEELGVSPGECFVVEDAANGVQAAKAGNMAALGLARAEDEDLLKEANADLVVTTLDDVSLDALAEGRLEHVSVR